MVALPIQGGCMCGALRYEITQPPLMIYNCHCTNCQKLGGGAFSTPATILEAAFRFVKGEARTAKWTSDAGNRRFGWFCGECGSRIANGQIPSIGMLSVRTGTFDDTSWVEPVGDIWTRSAQPWVALPQTRLRTEQQPGDYSQFIERYRAQGRFGI
ncbi:MAG TPA: GFA family protein [Candidatus Limnocylindrales bacterium]|nr:GFA family protein [Candidatus Limnocylindrales bacterium]